MDASNQPERIQLRVLAPVAEWSWVLSGEQCSICRNQLTSLCMHCESQKAMSSGCSVVWGECSHAFHQHCIQHWVQSRQVCPVDDKPWKEANRAAIHTNQFDSINREQL